MLGLGKKDKKPQWVSEVLLDIMDNAGVENIEGNLIKWAFITLKLAYGLGMPKPVAVDIGEDGFVLRWESKNGRSLEVRTTGGETADIKSRANSEEDEKHQEIPYTVISYLFTAWSAN